MSTPVLDLDLNLTQGPADPRVEEVHARTWAGMANWSVGPTDRFCSNCTFWNDLGRKFKNSATERSCSKFSELMGGAIGPRVPGTALGCRYHDLTAETRERRELIGAFCSPPETPGDGS